MHNIIVSEIKRIESTLINTRHNKTLIRLLSATKKELADIDIHQNYQNTEYLNILDSLFNQVQQLEKLKGLTPEAHMIVHNLLEEVKIRADIIESSNSVVSSGFKSLIDGLETKLAKNSRSN
jgi:hypothetical protein